MELVRGNNIIGSLVGKFCIISLLGMNKSAIAWFDIPTLQFERAVEFYSTILGVPIRIDEFMGQKLGFFPMDRDGEVCGDLVPPNSEYVPSHNGSRVYLNCEGKLDVVAGRVKKAGGKIIKEKFSIDQSGFIVLIEDTEGNIVGLYSHH